MHRQAITFCNLDFGDKHKTIFTFYSNFSQKSHYMLMVFSNLVLKIHRSYIFIEKNLTISVKLKDNALAKLLIFMYILMVEEAILTLMEKRMKAAQTAEI